MLRGVLVMFVVACGRLGFDAVPDGATVANLAPWQLIQTAGVEVKPPIATASVRVQPIGAGNLVVVATTIDTGAGLINTMTDSSGCNDYVRIADAAAHDIALDETIELYYAKQSCAGAVAITVSASATIRGIAVWEVAGIATTDPLDVAGAVDEQPSSSVVLGPKLTTTAPGDFVAAVAMGQFFVATIHAGDEFVNDLDTDGNGWAHLRDTQAPAGTYQAEWDQQPAGIYGASAAAFRGGR